MLNASLAANNTKIIPVVLSIHWMTFSRRRKPESDYVAPINIGDHSRQPGLIPSVAAARRILVMGMGEFMMGGGVPKQISIILG